jgi:hypothetical protein
MATIGASSSSFDLLLTEDVLRPLATRLLCDAERLESYLTSQEATHNPKPNPPYAPHVVCAPHVGVTPGRGVLTSPHSYADSYSQRVQFPRAKI